MTAPVVVLSDRQRQILYLVADGLTGPAIGRRLHLHHGSVRRHMAAVIELLGANNRTHAVAVAFRVGVLT
ncbi:MAG: helix-turn-helix transcriptional regulator [Actinoplanes sp.]